MDVKIIGICGGSGSGKTTIVKKITEVFDDFVFIAQDNYYKSAGHVGNDNITAFNFDHPDAFDMDWIYNNLLGLKQGKAVEAPVYDFVTHTRKKETRTIEPHSLIIFEGIMVFTDSRIRDLLDLKIYVDTPDDIRFIRRLKRDIAERGRTVDSVIEQYLSMVRPGHYEFIEPTKIYADIIIPEGGYNENALGVLLSYLKTLV
ncbi:uridine kinase [Spirochaetia bacterium 38H-sp]|uniref:Uridine kinase n=1 Tax=Rarispira pelagica TaxID=3141764 RepID=A0ABU9UBD4_9SPIR